MISTLDAEVFARYAAEAAFLWSVRHGAVVDPTHDLSSLCELDERIEAHLAGLALAGEAAWEICEAELAEAEPGSLFVAMQLAVGQGNLARVARVLDAWGGDPGLGRPLVSALGWLPLEQVQPILPGLLFRRCSPALHYLGIGAGALHRQDPGPALADALLSSDGRLRTRALRAAGELGRRDLLPEIQDNFAATASECQFAAARTAALLGEPAATPVLMRLAESGGREAETAAAMAARALAPAARSGWLLELSRSPGQRRAALAGAAALGDPVAVPWLLLAMESAETARAAAGALSAITGLDLAAAKLKARPPEGFVAGPSDDPDDDDVAIDPDSALPWPDLAGVKGWWQATGREFHPGTRYLRGSPMTPEWLVETLRDGSQPVRAAAAVELCMQHGGRGLFEVRAPGARQRKTLG